MKTTLHLLLSFIICFAAQILFLKDIKILGSNTYILRGNSDLNSNNQSYFNYKKDGNTEKTKVKNFCTSPTPVLSASPSDTICVGSSVTLTASGCNGITAWNTGTSGSILIVSPTTSTNYTATCTETGCEISLADTLFIAVNPIPNPPFIAAKLCNSIPSKVWDKRFGGSYIERLYSVLALNDKGYLLGGNSQSASSGDKTQNSRGGPDYWIVKIDSLGNKLWDKTFGGNNIEELRGIVATKDNGFLLAGSSESSISGEQTQNSRGGRDYWIVKIDSLGNQQWDKRFGGSGSESLNSIIKIENGCFLLGGVSPSPISGDKTEYSQGGQDYWVVKIDSVGNKIWDKSFGGSGHEELTTMTIDYDGGYLLGGVSESGISGHKSEASRGLYDWWIVKIDKNGTKVWDKTNGGSEDENLSSITLINNSYPPRYLFAGSSISGVSGDKTSTSRGRTDFWVMKANSIGYNIWDKCFGGDQIDNLLSVIPIENGAYLLGGVSTSGISGNKTEASRGGGDIWVIKMDSTGSVIWDKSFGGNSGESFSSMVSIGIGSYTLGGSTLSDKTGDVSQDSKGATDYWIVKMSSCQDVTTLCEGQNYTLTATGCVGRITWSNGLIGSSIVVNSSGTYNATCTVNNCSSAISNSVTIIPNSAILDGIANNGISGAANSIISYQTIPSSTNTTYQAGQSIYLIESFQTQIGSVFKAEIKGCN